MALSEDKISNRYVPQSFAVPSFKKIHVTLEQCFRCSLLRKDTMAYIGFLQDRTKVCICERCSENSSDGAGGAYIRTIKNLPKRKI